MVPDRATAGPRSSGELIPFPVLRQVEYRHMLKVAVNQIMHVVGNPHLPNCDEIMIAKHVQVVADKLTKRGIAAKHIAPQVIEFENALRTEIARHCRAKSNHQ